MKQNINEVSLECRDMRHAWMPKGDYVVKKSGGRVKVFSRSLECVRCSTVRIDTYSLTKRNVTRGGSVYRYPEGYQIRGGFRVADARFLLFKNMEMRVEGDDDK